MSSHPIWSFSLGSPMIPLAQPYEWHSTCSDHLSKGSQTSFNTCITVHHPYTAKVPSDGSRESVTSSRLRVRNENVVLERNTSQLSLASAPRSSNASSLRRPYKYVTQKSSWGNGSPTPPRVPSNLGVLLDTAPLEKVDLNARSDRHSLHNRKSSEYDYEYIPGIGFPSGTQKGNSALSSTQDSTPARPFTVASEHPFKADHTIQRWMSNLFRDGPNRKRSLKIREQRWTLDDFEENKTTKPDLAPHRKKYGHKKASSWSSFGLGSAAKTGTACPEVSVVDEGVIRSRGPSKSRFSKRSSRLSNGSGRLSVAGDQPQIQDSERSAWERAVQRRQVLEELVSSEQSHVDDLKVLLHVSHPYSSGPKIKVLTQRCQVYLTIMISGSKAAQAAQPEISRNVEEMLRLHEDILLQTKVFLAASESKPGSSTAAQERSKHTRWLSYESLEGIVPGRTRSSTRHSLDLPWFRRPKSSTGVSSPAEVADVAKVFERKV